MTRTADDRHDFMRRRQRFARVRLAEKQYARRLRGVADQIGHIVRMFDPMTASGIEQMQALLHRYAEFITPWARAAARFMLREVADRDEKAWYELSQEMSRNLRKEIRSAPIGRALNVHMDEQVRLIRSMPIEAAERIKKLSIEAQLVTGARAKQLAISIEGTGQVTRSRANLIARTEVATVSSALVRARSEHVGSTEYIWRTSMDGDVRKSHREMEGKVIKWDSPPTLSDGMTCHAGQSPNCRCYPEPIIPDPDF